MATGGAGIGQWGPMLLTVMVWAAAGLATAEAIAIAVDKDRRSGLWRDIRQALPWAAGLLAAQFAAFGLAVVMDPDFKVLGQVAVLYMIFAVLFPAIWATGRHHAADLAMPGNSANTQAYPRWRAAAALFIAGLAINFLTVALVDLRVGNAITGMSDGLSETALGVLAIWLILNAPWQEELVFRHYLLPRLAKASQRNGRRKTWLVAAAVITAAFFALGHAGHTEPAWPKLAQTFGWGLMLGWARIWLGTWYAVALHLAWNLTAPLFAPFIQT